MSDRLTTEDLAQQKNLVQPGNPDLTGNPDPAGNPDLHRTRDEGRDVHDGGLRDQDPAHADTAHRDDTTYQDDTTHRDDTAHGDQDTTRDDSPHDQDGDTAVDRDGERVEQRGPSREPVGDMALFTAEVAADYQVEWRALQSEFVDDPREAVRRADELVAQVMQNLATTFAEHKRSLEGQWQEGERVETEELRLALQRYRSFFDRLLSV